MTPPTPETLNARLLALCERASPGPWKARVMRHTIWVEGACGNPAIVQWNGFDSSTTSKKAQAANARLIAAARTEIPRLVQALQFSELRLAEAEREVAAYHEAVATRLPQPYARLVFDAVEAALAPNDTGTAEPKLQVRGAPG